MWDSDDDNDGFDDYQDAFPLDETEWLDTDADGIGENTDDDDADGVANAFDAFPAIAIGDLTDLDKDAAPAACDESCIGSGMTVDLDDDGDGWPDLLETTYGADPAQPGIGLSFVQRGSDIDGEASGDLSGTAALNADGNVIAVGAINNDGGGDNAGHVRVFELVGDARPARKRH